MWAQALPCPEFRAIGEVGRKEAAFIANVRLLDQLEVLCRQRLEDAVTVSGTLAPRSAGAACRRLADLEINVLGKALDELPALRERRAAGEGGHHAGGVDVRDHAERADNMPILFDEAWVAPQIRGDPLNQGRVQHARTR